MGSLQEQLLKAGLVDEQRLEESRKKAAAHKSGAAAGHSASRSGQKANHAKTGRGKAGQSKAGHNKARNNGATARTGARSDDKSAQKPSSRPQSDLEAAYRARARAEKREQEQHKAKLVAEQEQRRQRNVQLTELVEGRVLNDEQAEIPRYFNYMNKIRRILLTPEQLTAVNSGELGIAVLRSRPVLLDQTNLAAFRAIAPDLVPDLGGDEPSSADWDEQYQGFEVPDDLRW